MDFVLWPACVKTHPFAAQVRAAASAGFNRLPISPPLYRALQSQGLSAAEGRAIASDHGVQLGHYDGFSDWAPLRFSPSLPQAARAIFDFSADECLQICAELGLDSICAVGAFGAGEVELQALIDAFARFCERAATFGIGVDLEFIPMWGIPTLAMAWDIVRGAGCSNAAILFDTWHFAHGAADLDLLRALPAGSIRTVQLADARRAPPGADLFEQCLRFRELPGEGELPLLAVLQILQQKGGVTSIGPEIYADSIDRLDAASAAAGAALSSRTLLRQAGFSC
jgi:sugar phosphate isomerase/epimerase